jgi:hypothetical protein
MRPFHQASRTLSTYSAVIIKTPGFSMVMAISGDPGRALNNRRQESSIEMA